MKIVKRLFPSYVSRSTISLFLVNYFFQRFLRINAKLRANLHFSSRYAGSGELKIVGNESNLQLCLMSNPSIYINTSNTVITIDSSVYIASGVKIVAANHDVNNLNKAVFPAGEISIGRDCWLGANVVILPSVRLGPRTIVGAGAVVTKSFSGKCIIAGCPAKVIRNL